MADIECGGFSGGSIAGAVIGTFLATLVLGAIIYFLWDRQRKRRLKNSGLSNLVIVEDGGGTPGKNFTYDNPGFIEDSTDAKKGHHASNNETAKQNGKGKPVANQDGGKKMPWGPLSFLFKSRAALDDSALEEPQKYSVALKGHDFTGLGFSICGNMRDGIFVKDVMQRGPAAASNQVLPGDQITGMTVSFKQMVLEDAITLLSYASPYEVNLDMLRLSEKSLPHKGIMVSSPSHPSGSSNSTTLERVCHPFFKSQSIDDLRKVGKEHLDLKVDRARKQVNGVNKPTAAATLDIPTAVVVVPNRENRSSASTSSSSKIPSAFSVNLPNVNMDMHLNKNVSKNASEAHQKSQGDKNAVAVDEVDACRVPIPIVQQEIKVSGVKPEVIPRAKSKSSNVKAAPNVPVVEAISPVVKMAYEKEKQEKQEALAAAAKAGMAVLEIEPKEIEIVKPSVKVESTSITIDAEKKFEKGPSMIVLDEIPACWGQHLGTELATPEVSVTIEKEKEEIVKKPERGQKKDKVKPEKESKNKDKEKEKGTKEKENLKESKEKDRHDKEKDGGDVNGEKSKFSKFGIRVLPDISLNFGKGSKSSGENKEKENKEEKEGKDKEKSKGDNDAKEKKEKEPKEKSSKSKDKDKTKEKEKREKSPSPDTSNVNANEAESKSTTTSSSSTFKIHMPSLSLPKVELKRKDSKESKGNSENSSPSVTPDPDASTVAKTSDKSVTSGKQKKSGGNEMEKHVELPLEPTSVAVEMKEMKVESRPPSADSAGSGGADKSSPKKGGFHMPSLGIKLPKFGSSKQTYSFENTGDKDGKHSHSLHSDDLMIVASPSAKTDVSASAPEFMKMKVTTDIDDIVLVEKVSLGDVVMEERPSSKASVNLNLNTGEQAEEKSVVLVSSTPSASAEIPSATITTGSGASSPTPAEIIKEDNSKDNKDKEKDSGIKPGFMSKGLKGLREFKDKVTHKLSHDATQETSSEDEAEEGMNVSGEKVSKEKVKKTKKDKERDKSADAKKEKEQRDKSADAKKEKEQRDKSADAKKEKEKEQRDKSADAKREKEEKAKEKAREKERLKAEKKLKKEQLKKKTSKECGHSSASSTSSSDESEVEDKDKESKKKKIKIGKGGKDKKIKVKGAVENESGSKEKEKDKGEKKKEKKEKDKRGKSPESLLMGSEPEKSIESIQVSQSQNSGGVTQVQVTGHESKLIPAKPPVAPRKSKDSLNESGDSGKVKKSKSSSSSSSSSSSESDEEKKDGSGKEKPKKPKRSTKRKAPIPPMDTPSMESSGPVTITTSAEVMTPPKEIENVVKKSVKSKPDLTIQVSSVGSSGGVGNSSNSNSDSKTPESGRRSASFGDLSSLQSKSEGQNNYLLERAVSMDLTADSEQSAMMSTSSKIPVGSPLEDLSAMPDSTTIVSHFKPRDSIDSLSSSSSSETLKASPTSVVHVFPKETLTVVTHTHSTESSANIPTSAQINITNIDTNPAKPSEIEKMMNETISMMNNIVHTMDTPPSSQSHSISSQKITTSVGDSVIVQSHPHTHQIQVAPAPSSEVNIKNIPNVVSSQVQSLLVKSSDSTSEGTAQVTISTTGSSVLETSELERVAQEAIDDIISQIKLNGPVTTLNTGYTDSTTPKVTYNTVEERSNVNANENANLESVNVSSSMVSQESQVLDIKVNDGSSSDHGGEAPLTTAVQVKAVEMAMDVVEPVSQKNITVMNIKNAPKQDYPTQEATIATPAPTQAEIDAEAKAQQLLRGDSKSRLMQTVADANNIKVNPVSPNRRDSASMSSASSTSSVDSSPDIRSDSKPIFTDTRKISVNNQALPSNGQTIEISATELDGIMMSHAEFLAKQAAALGTNEKDPKDVSFDNWVYVDQKHSSDPSTSSHSDLEPSNSSNDDDDVPYNRNGALSPITFKMETQYETSELRVTTSPVPSNDSSNKTQTKVYSTTMTLPQKTVTQIVLGQDPADTITTVTDSATTTVTNGNGVIVSKITLDTTTTEEKNKEDLTTLPKLETLK